MSKYGLLGALSMALLTSAAFAQAPTLQDSDVSARELPERKAGERWVWSGDFASGLYGRSILVNADTGEYLGAVDAGWEGIKLDVPKSGDVFYNHGMFMARGFRGPRVDVVEIINRKSLNKVGEIELPAKMIRGWPNLNHSAIGDDDRFLFLKFFAPASSIGVVDLKQRRYVGEIETAGCAHVMAAGSRRFFALCGDGSALAVTVDDNGAEVSRSRLTGLFDPGKDPLHGTGVRSGDDWYFMTQLGHVKVIDVSGTQIKLKKEWAAGEKVGIRAWVPAEILQNLAFNKPTNRLFVLMADADLTPKGGGTDYHRQPGTEVWVWDAATGKRVSRIKLKDPQSAIAVSDDARPLLYSSSLWIPKLNVIDPEAGTLIRSIDVGQQPSLIQPVPVQ
jgi:methylamine dehydrogenase heavy chain